ncbi:M56 family metallopeptidase [Gelidibacter mesophilus]|uniref:M56 family metallopeptidase n=1 Tax=Gelidibacter mesophilus TaxID=169050 RepID=UPI0003F54979|nr:M56 family metallopeptidase [Gelidibacter mesophilus]
MLHYILQTIAFQVFFLIIYDAFLKKETFFNWNRAYLIGTAFLSFTLPFLKFESIKAIVPEPMIVRLPEVIIGEVSPTFDTNIMVMGAEQVSEQAITFSWTYVWLAGMVLAAGILVYKIVKIVRMLYKNPRRWQGDALFVFLLNSSAAFSFFHYIFLGIDIQAEKKEHIIQHEMVHVKEKHSLDLLIFEILRIVFWFNPLIYMYQNRLANLHEFIADAKAVKYKGKSAYFQSLLSQVFETQHISFINPFFKQSLIKKRIVMLSKSKSKQIHLIKYALLVPMVMGMLMYTSSYAGEIKDPFPIFQKESKTQELTFQELVDKYYNEILEMMSTEKGVAEVFKKYTQKTDNYIDSKENVAKNQAFMNYMYKAMKDRKIAEGEFKEDDDERYKRITNNYKTYEDYLAYKKTDLAKKSWEELASIGEKRLVVDDMGNLTEAEKKRKAELLTLVEKDDFYNKLNMTDGKSNISVDFTKKDKDRKKDDFEAYDIEVPFAVVDEVPIFTGCEDFNSNKERKQCMSDKVSMFVNKNFNVDIAKEHNLKGKQRISVIFKLGKDGKIREIKARAPHLALEEEAIRVIQLLPEFTPGKQKGKAVTVPYSLPILFMVQDDSVESEKTDNKITGNADNIVENVELREQNMDENIEVPFAVIEEAPTFPSCEEFGSRDSRRTCTSDYISQFVNKNFDVKLAKKLGLEGKQRMMVIFKIGTDGTISNIRARAPHPELEKEAIRVIGMLPKMLPGKQRGKAVIVPYSLPILFNVQK